MFFKFIRMGLKNVNVCSFSHRFCKKLKIFLGKVLPYVRIESNY